MQTGSAPGVRTFERTPTVSQTGKRGRSRSRASELGDPGALELALHLGHARMLPDDAVEPIGEAGPG
jgi:hypothetical protein